MSFDNEDYKITIKQKFEYGEDTYTDIFHNIQTYDIFMCSFVNNRYPSIYTLSYKTTDNEEFNNAQDAIKEKYKTPFIYKSVSRAFNLHYSFLYQAIKKKKYNEVAIFDNAIDSLENMLYHASIYDTKSHIDYNYLYLIEKEIGLPKFEELMNKLAKYYDQSNYNIIINKNNICSKIEDQNYKKKYDLVIFNYTIYKYGTQFNEREIIHFSNIIMMTKILSKGGDYLFKLRGFSKNYVKQIIFLLLKFFKKVSFIKSELYTISMYIMCEHYIPIDSSDYETLLDILKKWDKINPNCGDNLNFSDKELREQYRIKEPFDKKQVNKFVTNLFDFYYPKEFTEQFNTFFDKHYKKLEKMKTCNKLIKKTTDELSADQLVTYYDKNYKNNYGRLIEFSKKYKLPLKPEVITSAKKYQQKILRETVSISSSSDIILKDYSKDPFKFNAKSYKYKDYNYDFPNLLKNKYELNLHKIAIDSREQKYYSEVTEKINIPRFITVYIKNNYNIKITRAFIKMFELLNEYKLIDMTKESVKVFHTCEAPGHFINATNYFIKLNNKNMKYDWYANSLNPYNQENKKKYGNNIFGDAYGYLKKYSSRWLWGKDGTGDITNVENIKEYEKRFNYTLDLFTSDCGLGATSKSDFFDQEKRLSILNFSQCLIALTTLKIGGNAVFKVFIPLVESITVSVLFLLMKHFKNVYFIKQSAGSPGSSEIYVIALNKTRHLEDDLKNYLYDCLKNFDSNNALFPKETFDSKFINQIEAIGVKFAEDQIDTMNRSTFYYDWPDTLKEHEQYIEDGKKAYVETWIEKNGFKTLDKSLML